MKQTLKRMLSLTLVFCMLLSMLPTSVFAASDSYGNTWNLKDGVTTSTDIYTKGWVIGTTPTSYSIESNGSNFGSGSFKSVDDYSGDKALPNGATLTVKGGYFKTYTATFYIRVYHDYNISLNAGSSGVKINELKLNANEVSSDASATSATISFYEGDSNNATIDVARTSPVELVVPIPVESANGASYNAIVEVDGTQLEGIVSEDGATMSFNLGNNDSSKEITVTYSEALIKKNESIGTVGFNPKKSVSEQLDALKQNIFNAVVNKGESLPEGITVDDVSIQYIPWYYGEVTQTYKHSYEGVVGVGAFDETPHDLTATPTEHTGHTGYTFGALFAEGKQTTEKVILTGIGSWAGLSVEAEITLVDSRQEVTITNNGVADVTVTNSEDPILEAVKNATTITSGSVSVTPEYEKLGGTMPTATTNTTEVYKYKVSVEEGTDNLGAELEVTVNAVLKQYTIYWDTDADGDRDETTLVYYGVVPTAPDAVQKDGYSATWPTLVGAIEDTTYTVVYSADTIYTVNYVTNIDGYAINSDSYNVTDNAEIVTVAPTVEDQPYKIFDGWYTDANFENEYVFGTTPTEDIILYAKWAYDKYDNNVRDENETVKVVIEGNGTVTIDGTEVANEASYIYDSTKTDNVVVVTPSDLDGSDGSAEYVESCTVADGSYSSGVYTVTTDLDTSEIAVVIGTKSMTNQGGTLELNGYVVDGLIDDYSARWENIKANVLTATLGGYDNISDYTVSLWLDFSLGEAQYHSIENTNLIVQKDRLTVPAYGKTGSLKVKIVKAASADGEIVELTLTDAVISTKESREPAQVGMGSAVTGSFDTLDAFKSAVENSIWVKDNNNNDCKANAGLTVTLNPVEGKVNTYTVSYSLANDGATWLTTSGTLDGEVVWNVSTYKVTFLNDDGTTISEKEYPYGTTADQIEVPTATKANEVDENGNIIARYTFAGWNPTVDTVTGEATYTATYNRVVEKYTITWKNGDETTTEEYEYGATPVAPTASKTSTAQYHFTNGTWGEIATVTGDATYTATFTEELRSYTITWENGDETTTEEYEYGATPVAPTASKTSTAQYHFINGTWGEIATVTGDATYTATFTEELRSYAITWVIKGKEIPETESYGYQITHDDLAGYTTTEAVYTFKGWKIGDSETVINGSDLPVLTGDVTITAVFSSNPVYQVTVNPDNGTGTTSTPVENGETFEIPADPTKSGYRFMGWKDQNGNDVSGTITISENTTITAQWSELFTITWMNDGKVYQTETDKYIAGETPVAPADPSKAADAQYTYTFAGWTPTVDAITGDTTYTAQYTSTVNSYTIYFVDENGNPLYNTTLNYGEQPVYGGDPIARQYYSYSWDPHITPVSESKTYKLVWTPNNDTNTNGIADELETATVTVEIEGNGTVTLTPAGNATLQSQNGNIYTYLYDSTDAANKVINVTATPNDTNATDGNVDYLISAPATVNVGETVNAKFGTVSFTVNENPEIKVNGYSDETKAEELKTLILDAAFGAGNYNADDYTVYVNTSFKIGEIEVPGSFYNVEGDKYHYNILGYEGAIDITPALIASTIAIGDTESVKIVKNGDGGAIPNVSKTLDMTVVEKRTQPGLKDYTETEENAKTYDSVDKLKEYVTNLANGTAVNPNGVTVTITSNSEWPTVAGVPTEMKYTVSYTASEEYLAQSVTITVWVMSSYSNCTVSGSVSNGNLYINGTDTDSATVPGNSDVTIAIRPNDGYYVSSITVTGPDGDIIFGEDDIEYTKNDGTLGLGAYREATVSFKTNGATASDAYTVTAELKAVELKLNEGQTIEYCVDDTTIDITKLDELVWNAVFGGATAPMTKDNTTIEFKSGSTDLSWKALNEALNFAGLGHKFGENGSETIRLTYEDAKYGKLQGEVVLNVYDSCYSVKVNVNTVTNGADATIKTQYSADTRAYLNVNYFKQGEELTVTLTPDGEILEVLGQMYNGTYAEKMAYIKSVTVTDKNGNAVDATLTRGQGKLSLDSILSGVNPLLFNAAVTFTLEADEEYTVTVEYGIHELPEASDATLPMYQGGKDYAAEVPSVQELISAILGGEEAAEFLETYGGGYTVEFTKSLLENKWTAVSDEELLALSDGSKITVRITWKPGDTNMIYYPVATTAEVTLVDLRTATSVQGTVPTEQVEYVEESQLISNLKTAMKLGISANNSALDVNYTVTYNMKGNETDGFFADVTVSYDGSAEYKPTSKTFENVPIADLPDNSTIKVTIQNASDVVTNNDGKIQTLDTTTGTYTVIGNGTYNFKFTPATGYAIESVTVNGKEVELTYSKQTASFSMGLNEKEYYEVVVETVSSVWVLEEEPTYDFATGIDKPDNSDIVKAVTTYPTDIDFEQVEVEYLARAEGKVTVSLPDIDLGVTVIELGTFDIDLGELWLNPEESVDMVSEDQLDKILENLVDDIIYQVSMGELDATKAFDYIQTYVKNLPLGIHAFGANGDDSTETIRFSYEDDKYLLAQVQTDVTIHDYRIATEIVANDCTVTYGYSLNDLIIASGAAVNADGAAVDGLEIETDDLYLHAGEQTVTLYFAGDETYQPSEVTINVTVNKASVDIDYDSQQITYGDDYDFSIAVAPQTHNDGTKVDPDMIEFMIGVDMSATLDFGAEQDFVGLGETVGEIRLRLPETIRELPLVGQYLQGEFTLSEFTNLINSLDNVLGLDESSMEILNQVVGVITGITDNMEIKVIVEDEEFHPTNIGVYIAGAVTVDADYETAYTADYLVILPTTNEVALGWKVDIRNNMVLLPAWNAMDKGADVVGGIEDEKILENFAVKYLVLGINSDTSEFLTTDIYGNIKANIWLDPEDVKDNGAYVQIAYGMHWGNDIYYAIPIVRAFAIIPGTADVQLVGATGEPNNDLLKTFNNEPQGFSVIVKDNNDEIVYSDHYQNVVELKENAQCVVYYTGMQTNGKVYNSLEKPVHAGVYTAIAVYAEFNDGVDNVDLSKYTIEYLSDNIDIENFDFTGLAEDLAVDLYSLFDLVCIGMDAGVLVIEPTTATVTVEDVIEVVDGKKAYNPADQVTAVSTVEGLKPDTTIITAGIGSNGYFSENGWDAINGAVNVDFPKWVDALLAKYAPSVVDGITISNLSDKLTAKVPEITAAMEAEGVSNEVLNSFANAVESVVNVLAQMPEDVVLSFSDDITYTNVGTYVVVAVVTDSDHYPAVDAGLLVITPNVTQVNLEWNYEDENGIFTRDLMNYVDLWATAYEVESAEKNEAATEKITYQFIGIDSDNEPVIHTDPANLPNGAYIEVAYIGFELDGQMYISDMIARPVVVIPSNVDVTLADDSGAENRDRVFTYEYGVHNGMDVVATSNDGIDLTEYGRENGYLTVRYVGMQSDLTAYNSTEAPMHAGAYTVTATYLERDENNQIIRFGMDVGAMVIEPAKATVNVESAVKDYKYLGQVDLAELVEVSPEDAKYTLITASISKELDSDEVDGLLNAVTGAVNVDFPARIDAILSQVDALAPGYDVPTWSDIRASGITVSDFLSWMETAETYFANMGIEADMFWFDGVKEALMELDGKVFLTFLDQGESTTFTDENGNVHTVTTDPEDIGTYLLVAVVTDPDYYPAMDMGILVIAPTIVELDMSWNQEFGNDFNYIFSSQVDAFNWGATAEYVGDQHDQDNYSVEHLFVGVTEDGTVYSGTEHPTVCGVYEEIVWVKMELDTEMQIGEPMMRTFTILPNVVDVYFETENGLEKAAAYTAVYGEDSPVEVVVVTDHNEAEIKEENIYIYYAGANTKVEGYGSTEYPETPGAYVVTAVYYDDEGNVIGTPAVGSLIIDLATLDSFSMGVNEFTYGDIDENTKLNAVTAVTAEGETITGDDLDSDKMDYIYLVGANEDAGENNLRLNGIPEDVVNLIVKCLGKFVTLHTDEETGCYMLTASQIDKLLELMPQILTELGMESTWEEYAGLLEMALEMIGVDGDANVLINAPLPVNVGEYLLAGFCYSKYYHPKLSVDMDNMGAILDSKLVIKPMEIVLKPVDSSKTFGDTDPEFTYTINGETAEEFVAPYEDTISATVTRVTGENVGTYDMSIADVSITERPENYNVKFETGTFEIAKRDIIIAIDNATVEYGENLMVDELTYKIYTIDPDDPTKEIEYIPQNNDGLNLELIADYTKGQNVGTYEDKITVKPSEYRNFNIDQIRPGDICVTPKKVQVVMKEPDPVMVGMPLTTLTSASYEIVGVISGDEGYITVNPYYECEDEYTKYFEPYISEDYPLTVAFISGVHKRVVTANAYTTSENYEVEKVVAADLTIDGIHIAVDDTSICVGTEPEFNAKLNEENWLRAAFGQYFMNAYAPELSCDSDGTKIGKFDISLAEGYEKQYVIDGEPKLTVTDHDMQETTAAVEPTCETAGKTAVYTCANGCGKSEGGEEIPAGHKLTQVAEKTATCTEAGWKAYEYCSECNYTTYKEIPATGHNYKAVVTEPTCTAGGYTTYTCQCGDSYTAGYTDALGHTYKSVVTEPTCTKSGYTTYTCSCGSTYVDDITAPKGHNHVAVVTAPTCTERGYTTHTCSCGDSYVDTYVDATGHSWNEGEVTTPATAEEEGVKTYTCTECNDTKTEAIPALGHEYDDGTVTKAPTCTEKGEMTYKCKNCANHTYTKEIDALGHKLDEGKVTEPTCTTMGYTTYTCTNDGCKETVKDKFVSATGHTHIKGETTAPTCTERGYTTYTCHCGDSYKADFVEATGHTAELRNVKAATCTEKGYTGDEYCKTCNEKLTTGTETPALGHKEILVGYKEATATTDGYTGDAVCETCGEVLKKGEVIPAFGEAHTHKYTSKVTKEATCTEDGVKTFTCACGNTYTDVIKAAGHKWSEWKPVNDPSCFVPEKLERKCSACGEVETKDGDVDTTYCPSEENFPDIFKTQWYHKATDFVIVNGLMNGTGDGNFTPNGGASRAMIVTTIYRMEGSPAVSGKAAYPDVEDGVWYTNAIIWGTQNGIVNGYGNGNFGPNDIVTREQIATIFRRYAEFKGMDASVSADLTDYPDDQYVSDWAMEGVKWGVGTGLITGRGIDGVQYLSSKDGTIRTELATILMRWCKEFAN